MLRGNRTTLKISLEHGRPALRRIAVVSSVKLPTSHAFLTDMGPKPPRRISPPIWSVCTRNPLCTCNGMSAGVPDDAMRAHCRAASGEGEDDNLLARIDGDRFVEGQVAIRVGTLLRLLFVKVDLQ